jgi:uncharacterized protein YdeI (YjbR/CyaY-like superfamily)
MTSHQIMLKSLTPAAQGRGSGLASGECAHSWARRFRVELIEMTRTADLNDPASPNGKDVMTPANRAEWRRWLAANPDRHEGLWIVYRKKSSSLDGPVYDDLVEEALCFGWIDSQSRRVDGDRMMQWFSPRRKGGLWSALNKERIERLVRAGLMTTVGQATIEEAKADGSWSQTDEVDALIVPADLEAALDAAPEARATYYALIDSAKKQYLWWIHSAKRPATRMNRIEETVRRLASGESLGST